MLKYLHVCRIISLQSIFANHNKLTCTLMETELSALPLLQCPYVGGGGGWSVKYVAVLVLPPVVDNQSCATQPPSMMVLREDRIKIEYKGNYYVECR